MHCGFLATHMKSLYFCRWDLDWMVYVMCCRKYMYKNVSSSALELLVPIELLQALSLETFKPGRLALLWEQSWTRCPPQVAPQPDYSCLKTGTHGAQLGKQKPGQLSTAPVWGDSVSRKAKLVSSLWVCRGRERQARGQPLPGPPMSHTGASSVFCAYSTSCYVSSKGSL